LPNLSADRTFLRMRGTSLAYRIFARAATGIVPLAGLASGKIARGHQRRRGAADRLIAWASTSRDRSRPLAWFHASSVGEGLQAESVLLRVRARHPEWQFVFTHYSPSAEALARRLPVDLADYLPYDLPGEADRVLDAIAPSALVFAKLDLWPEWATRAARRGTAVALVAATVRPGSGRLRWPVRAALAPGYAAVSAAGAISRGDAERLARLGVRPERIKVTGDARFDSVSDKVAAVRGDDPLLRLGNGAPTLVAGSTWPGDERVLLDAFARLHVHRPEARLVLAPHEPTAAHLDPIERAASRLGLPPAVRLSAADGPVPFLLVDRVGVLATLYGAGTMAYVGGGFGRAGLHSVLEPAAWGVPVAFGPRWQESRDAGLLLEAGGGESLPAFGREEAGEALHALWNAWIQDEARRSAQGRKARRVVDEGRGAADASAAMIEELVLRAT
jgi:3-deoxy-D-manno-octulosonic-acid transferase